MELTTTYFETVGRVNTDEVFRIVRKRVQELGIKTVLVASTMGDTAVKAAPMKFTEENRSKVESAGGVVLTATYFFGGLDRAIKAKAPGMYLPGDIVASTLRLFGSGMKVVCEIGIMAADAGLVGTDLFCILICQKSPTQCDVVTQGSRGLVSTMSNVTYVSSPDYLEAVSFL